MLSAQRFEYVENEKKFLGRKKITQDRKRKEFINKVSYRYVTIFSSNEI